MGRAAAFRAGGGWHAAVRRVDRADARWSAHQSRRRRYPAGLSRILRPRALAHARHDDDIVDRGGNRLLCPTGNRWRRLVRIRILCRDGPWFPDQGPPGPRGADHCGARMEFRPAPRRSGKDRLRWLPGLLLTVAIALSWF